MDLQRRMDNLKQRAAIPVPTGDLDIPGLGAFVERTRVDRPYSLGGVWDHPAGIRVIATSDDTEPYGPLLHVSISRIDRFPDWSEITAVRDFFFGPDRDAMMVMPRAADYVNIASRCFHVWQCPERWGIR